MQLKDTNETGSKMGHILRMLFHRAPLSRDSGSLKTRFELRRLSTDQSKRPFVVWPALVIALVIMGAVRCKATTYAVKASGGGNFTTIQACATAAAAGDTCVVFAGTYNEKVQLAKSGTVGKPITFKANAGDVVNVSAFDVTQVSYITIGGSGATEGFLICNGYTSAACIQMYSSSHITIQHNIIGGSATTAGGSTGCINNAFGSAKDSSYVSILNNTVQWCGLMGTSDPTKKHGESALYLRGNHWLIEGNDFEHSSDFISNSGGYYNVIRNNTMQNVDCIADFGMNNLCHVDVLELACSTSISPLGYTVFENNVAKNLVASGPVDGRGVHGVLAQSACTGVTTIMVRFNTYNNISDILVQGDTTQGGSVDRLKTFNNTFANNQNKNYYASIFIGQNLNGSSINNLYYNMFRTDVLGIGFALDSTTVASFTGSNDLFYQAGTSWSGFAATESGHVFADPKVTSLTDLHLLPTSPAIGGGTYLTTVANTDTGSGTSLIVNEAAFFQDGFGIPGVQPDWIRLGTSTVVQVAAINYASNTITLANSVTRTPGNPVYLFKLSDGTTVLYGNSPDIGALPFAPQRPSPPSGLSVSVT